VLKDSIAKILSIIFAPPTFSSLLVLVAIINEEVALPKMHAFLIGLIALTIAPYLSVIFAVLLKKDNIGVPERKNRNFHLIYGLINYSFSCILFSLIGIKILEKWLGLVSTFLLMSYSPVVGVGAFSSATVWVASSSRSSRVILPAALPNKP